MLSGLDHDAPVVDPEANSTDQLIQRKFGYVVACQVYGKLKKEQDSKADDIDFLLRKFPNLRVAYIDEKQSKSGESNFYSVLIRAADDKKTIEEIYRVRLPGDPILGEGKPENQNHAVIFTRGEYLQAIDMNQDGFFEEALKHRNLQIQDLENRIQSLSYEIDYLKQFKTKSQDQDEQIDNLVTQVQK